LRLVADLGERNDESRSEERFHSQLRVDSSYGNDIDARATPSGWNDIRLRRGE
jgi:hypothetical protein